MKNRYLVGAAAWLAAATIGGAMQAQTFLEWNDPGVDDWSDPSNWSTGFVPDVAFGEVAVISNGGTAFVDAPPITNTGGVILGRNAGEAGALELRAGGALTSASGGTGVPGAVVVGQSGRGELRILSGGELNAPALSMGGDSASLLTLDGTASVALTGAATLGRRARITGPDVTFTAGSLNIPDGARFTPVITGATHTTLEISGNASLGGMLAPEFVGHVPAPGDSWTLVDATALLGRFSGVDVGAAPALPRGAAYRAAYDLAAGRVSLNVESALVMTVNRASGAVSIENAFGGTVDITGYAIESSNGWLDPADWVSWESSGLAGDGWQDANPLATHLAELNLEGAHAIGLGEALSLGDAYASGAIRPADEDIEFTYSTATGEVVEGIVEYIGPVNDLVLRVDPETGAAVLRNLSGFVAPDITGYVIASASGSLSVAGWQSFEESGLAGDGWLESNPQTTHLAELNLESSTLFNTGRSLSIGNIMGVDGTRDLVLQYTTVDNQILTGVVEYGDITAPLLGDTNGDGNVNLDDLNNVRNFFGTPSPDGDADHDGDTDLDDLNAVRNHFGGMAGGAESVPEPSALLLCGISGLACAARLGRRATGNS